MALKRELYTALEDVLGTENISEDPVILDSYAWRSGSAPKMETFVSRYEAVTLPNDTEEVQAIVKLCNKYGVHYKASSTGWGRYNDPGGPGVVKMDLRRMNRILEINEKNMYAVVEPYVIGAQLQAELMKRGLNCNLTGAGSNCSAHPLVAHGNYGHMGQTTSYGERNLLAVEWVAPDGEIIRLGSLGSLGEWFCGDGPGPSLRGILRGSVAPLGGLGVFTRAAAKAYHWPGTETFPIEGVSPRYAPSRMPPNFLIRYLSFTSLEKMTEAVQKISESEIAFLLMGFNPTMMASNLATSNEEDVGYAEQINRQVQGPGFLIIIAGNSARDFKYKKQVLEQIKAETGGKSLELIEDPKVGGALLWRCTRVSASIREVMRATGVFGGLVGGTDHFRLMAKYVDGLGKYKADLIKRRLIVPDSTLPLTQAFEHGHYGHGEILIRYTQNPETVKALGELLQIANKRAINEHFAVPHHVFGDEAHELYGPHTSDYHLWLRKIKKTFDPGGVSDPTHYISGKE